MSRLNLPPSLFVFQVMFDDTMATVTMVRLVMWRRVDKEHANRYVTVSRLGSLNIAVTYRIRKHANATVLRLIYDVIF